jgi:L-alanine-DL-glutamate epimerase-like enolase superfamily enzyme
VKVKIAYGENIALPSVLQRLGRADGDGIDIVRPDATYQLGITGYMQSIAPALENRVTVFPHYFPDLHGPLVGGLGGDWIEESPAEADTVNFQLLRAEQPKIREGVWYLNEKPGLGIAWDEEALSKFRSSE